MVSRFDLEDEKKTKRFDRSCGCNNVFLDLAKAFDFLRINSYTEISTNKISVQVFINDIIHRSIQYRQITIAT